MMSSNISLVNLHFPYRWLICWAFFSNDSVPVYIAEVEKEPISHIASLSKTGFTSGTFVNEMFND